MSGIFIAGTGTDIGKTFVCAGLIRTLKARGLEVGAVKPVVTGFEPSGVAASDPGHLLAALGRPATLENIAAISPWRFAAPLSPDMAARREGRPVDFRALVDFSTDFSPVAARENLMLVEGVGGVMVPLDGERTTLDWIAATGFPAILVCGSYLGALSHTLSALAVLKQRGVEVLALVVNETPGSPVPLSETLRSLNAHAPYLTAVTLTRDAQKQQVTFAKLADLVVRPVIV